MAETPLTPATPAGAPVSGEPEALTTQAPASEPPVEATTNPSPELAAVTENEPAEPSVPAAPQAPEAAAPEPVEPADAPEAVETADAPEHVEPAAAASPVEAAVAPAPAEPAVAATLEVPPLPVSTAGEGGEWDLLRSRVGDWLERNDLAGQWQRLQGPLRLLSLLILLLVVLRLYGALTGTLESLPLVPGLLELVGVLSFGRFCLNRLVRSEERRRLQIEWSQRWRDFRGKP